MSVSVQCHECDADVEASARSCHGCGTTLARGSSQDDAPPDDTAQDHTLEGHTPEDLETSVLAAPVTDGERRTCPSCGAPNSVRRELCGRCGADLETGVSPPRPTAGRPTPQGPGRADPDRRRVSPWLVVAVLALVVVAAAGALTLAGLGPLADLLAAPQVSFDAQEYDDEPSAVALSDIATSSTLPAAGGESYHAPRMVDDDPATAWHSDGSDHEDGVGETIDLFLAEPAWVQRIVVDNGDQGDSEAYADNARIRRAWVRFDGGEQLSIRLEDLGLQRQAIELPEPLLTSTVRLEVTEAFAGDTYPDLAVAGVELQGWTATGDDIELARERAEADRASPPSR